MSTRTEHDTFGPIDVTTEPLYGRSVDGQTHDVFFNRGVASSQAYSRQFGGLAPDDQPTAAKRINRAVRTTPLEPDWVEATLASLEALILAGDEANLAERVVDLIAAPGGNATKVVLDE